MKLVKMSLIAAVAVASLSIAAFAAVVEEKVFPSGYMSSNDGNDSASLSSGTTNMIIFVTEKQGLTPKATGEWKIEPTGQKVKIMAKIDPSDKRKWVDFKKSVLGATIVKARTDMIFDFAGEKVDLTVKLDPMTTMWNKSEKSLVTNGQKLHFTAKLDPAIAKLLKQHEESFIGAKTHVISDLTGQKMKLIIKLEPVNKTWKEHEKPMLKVDVRTGDRSKVKMLKHTYSPESVGTIGQGMKNEPVLRADARTSKVGKYEKFMKVLFTADATRDALKLKMLKYAYNPKSDGIVGQSMKLEPVLKADARTDDSLRKYRQPMTPLLRADIIHNISLDPTKVKTVSGEYDKSLIFFESHKLSALGKSQFGSGTVSALIAA